MHKTRLIILILISIFIVLSTGKSSFASDEPVAGQNVVLTKTFNEKGFDYTMKYPADWVWEKVNDFTVIFSGQKGTPAYNTTVNVQTLVSTSAGGKYKDADAVIEDVKNQLLKGAKDVDSRGPDDFELTDESGRKISTRMFGATYTYKGDKLTQILTVFPSLDGKIIYSWSYTAPQDMSDSYSSITGKMLKSFEFAQSFGGSNAKQLPIKIELATTEEEKMYGLLFQSVLVDTCLRYADARVYADALIKADPKEIPKEEWLKFYGLTKTKLSQAEEAVKRFDEIVQILPEESSVAFNLNPQINVFVSLAYAEEKVPIETVAGNTQGTLKTSKPILEKGEEAQVLNESIIVTIGKTPPKSRGQLLTTAFGTSINNDKERIEKCQEIYNQFSQENTRLAESYAEAQKNWENAQLAADVGLFFGGLSTGASELILFDRAIKAAKGLKAAMQWQNLRNVVAVSIAGADLGLTVSQKGAEVGIGFNKEQAKLLAKAQEGKVFSAFKTIFAIRDIAKYPKDLFNKYNEEKQLLIESGKKMTDAELRRQALHNLFLTEEKRRDFDSNTLSNMRTIYDLDKQLEDYLNEHPEAKSINIEQKGDNIEVVSNEKPLQINADGIPMRDIGKLKQLESLTMLVDKTPVISPVPQEDGYLMLKKNSQVWDCIDEEYKSYANAREAMVNARKYPAKYYCGWIGANWQEVGPTDCCQEFERNKSKNMDEAWYTLQFCAWKPVVEKRKAELDKKIEYCRGRNLPKY